MIDIFVLVGCEESQAVTIELHNLGIKAFSCDLKPCSGGRPEWHLHMNLYTALNAGSLTTQNGTTIVIPHWHAGIFFPDCTYLTCSAEWAYKDGPYHQKVKPGTLVGQQRIFARQEASDFFKKLYNMPEHPQFPIKHIAIENPIGVMSRFVKPSQIIHPFMFGDDASKSTCIWVRNLPILTYKDEQYCKPRMVWDQNFGDYRMRWANQTDSGQNKLSPSDNRAELRSKTYPGIAKAMATQWSEYLKKRIQPITPNHD